MPFRATEEGIAELAAAWTSVLSELRADLTRSSLDAADYGVSTMQQSHPYEDQTYNLSGSMHVEPSTDDEGNQIADLKVDADYASFVNDGTSRAQAYPFMPLGEYAAGDALQTNAESAAEAACQKMNGR